MADYISCDEKLEFWDNWTRIEYDPDRYGFSSEKVWASPSKKFYLATGGCLANFDGILALFDGEELIWKKKAPVSIEYALVFDNGHSLAIVYGDATSAVTLFDENGKILKKVQFEWDPESIVFDNGVLSFTDGETRVTYDLHSGTVTKAKIEPLAPPTGAPIAGAHLPPTGTPIIIHSPNVQTAQSASWKHVKCDTRQQYDDEKTVSNC
ncbi:MAG: hypothetical protein FWD27_04515 [Coriobacteriia bacterium]|nr:hypothetical protein [Coriobacteriia bacterium]